MDFGFISWLITNCNIGDHMQNDIACQNNTTSIITYVNFLIVENVATWQIGWHQWDPYLIESQLRFNYFWYTDQFSYNPRYFHPTFSLGYKTQNQNCNLSPPSFAVFPEQTNDAQTNKKTLCSKGLQTICNYRTQGEERKKKNNQELNQQL